MKAALPEGAADKPVEVWFTDEARVGQQGTVTRIWAKRGSRPRAPRDRREIVEAILDGRQPAELGLPRLMKPLPVVWSEQRSALIPQG